MPFPVQLTAHAVGDLEDILAYIDRRDGPNRVEQVLDQIEQTLQGLSHHSHHGSYPDEFLDMGIREYRQDLSRPYRVIYRVIGESVYVFLTATPVPRLAAFPLAAGFAILPAFERRT